MKMLKIMPILSLAFAVTLSVVGVAAFGAPVGTATDKGASVDIVTTEHTVAQGTRVIEVADSEQTDSQLNIDGIYRVLLLNRLFGTDIHNDVALVEEAQIALLDCVETVDGASVIRRETVNDFIKALYGHTVQNRSDAEYYVVAARGFDPIGHEITDISTDDGKVTVTSLMRVGGNAPVKAVTVLTPCQNEFGYMIISADIVE